MFIEKIQPRLSEMNPAGHIGYVVLPVWFEQANEKIYRLFNPELDPEKWSLIVVKFEMECLTEIFHDNAVTIETRVEKIGNSSFTISQTLKKNEKTAAKARTKMVYFDYQKKRSQAIPKTLRQLLVEHSKPE